MRVRHGLVPRVVLALVVTALLAGCELQAELNVDVAEDGSGTVEVGVGLDDEALERRPDVFDELAIDDLLETGWTQDGPAVEADGLTWVRLRHDFARPEEVGPLVEEVAGEQGPFRDFSLTRDDSFAETTYDFAGTVDFTRGLESVTEDEELAEALDAEPIEVLEQQIGQAVDQLVQVRVGVRLPGDVESNAPTQADNGAVWQPSVLEREALELSATGELRRTERYVWTGVAVAAGIALVLLLSVRLVAWRRRRRGEPEPG